MRSMALAMKTMSSEREMVRGQMLALKETEFVEAARAIGVRDRKIVTKHLLPNGIGPIIVAATLEVGSAIITESSLSFLGLGVTEPTAAWGLMLQDTGTFSVIGSYPWILSPVVFVLITVFAFNALGDGLRVPGNCDGTASFAGPDGRFSRRQFEEVLRSNGLTEQRFLSLMRIEIAHEPG